MKTDIYDSDGKGSPGVVVPRDPEPHEVGKLMNHVASEVIPDAVLEEWLSEPAGFLQMALDEVKMNQLSSTGIWMWDRYQLEYFQTISSFICNKCRQSGGSAMLSAKGFVKGVLATNNYNMILTSYKKEEAINKIDYVRQYLAALPPTFRKKIIRDPRQLIEFENLNGTRVKILSHAQKPIRGINGDIGLDELAFYQWAEEVYSSAGPATAMSRSTIDIISTPFGKSGIFYEIFSDRHKYAEYKRMPIMWWFVLRYLKEPTYAFAAEAYMKAPFMTTEERVNVFGNSFLVSQYNKAVDEETFRQEFEGLFVDAQAAFFTKDEIIRSMFYQASSIDDYDPRETDFEGTTIEEALEEKASIIQQKFSGVKDRYDKDITFYRYNSMIELANAVKKGKVSRNLYAGLDIGMTRHSSHFVVFEEVYLDSGETLMIERFSENIHESNLDIQEAKYMAYLSLGIITNMYGDASGIGKGLCQRLEKRFRGTFRSFVFTPKSKEDIYVNLKNRLSHGRIALAYDKLTIESIYSVDRVITATGTVSFKAEERKRHHGDAADAIALAIWGGRVYGDYESSIISPASVGKDIRREIENNTVQDRLSRIGKSRRIGRGGGAFNPGRFIGNFDS